MSANLDNLVPELADAARDLVAAAGSAGLLPRVTSTVRSRAEQTRLFRRSQQGLQTYPVAPPGFSAHEYGWAFDLVVSPFDRIYDVADLWLSWGGAWNAGDAVHFELQGASAEARRQAEQLGQSLEERAGTGFWESIITGLPFGFWPSSLLALLGIPSSAKKDITPAQEAALRRIVKSL